MDKTININLGGTLFQIDENAFRILRDYLQEINSRFANVQGGHETIDDIESRIAEIFQSQKGIAGVITRPNVEAMISVIGKPEDFDHGETETAGPVYSYQKKRMYRNSEDKIIGGVCSGIAAYLETDPVLFRILFVLSAVFFGAGFLIYIALWIALPEARSDSQKRAMYGNSYHTTLAKDRTYKISQTSGTAQYNSEYYNSSRVGNAINEIFRAIGRVCYIILRIFLIIAGVILVLTGFLFILSFVMIFVFKYPGAFSIDSSGMNLIYFPDFLNYIVNPSTVPWIIILASIAFILPMIALIYWGVKMIFWFRANDGVISLVGLVFWVMTIAALTIICFNEGISFAQTAKTSEEKILQNSKDTLYIMSDQKTADLKYHEEINLPHEEYTVFINDEKKELYIRPSLSVYLSDNKTTRLEVNKSSTGRTESEALKKTDGLIYRYQVGGDTIHFDEYFTSPSGRKWSADNVGLTLYIPAGTILKFEKDPRIRLHNYSFRNVSHDYLESRLLSNNGIWLMTEDGLRPVEESSFKRK
jgi:phage shock protein PspC (stress-responsive transcriptional regulator)